MIRSGAMSDERGGMGDNERGSQAARSLGHQSAEMISMGAWSASSRARRVLPVAVGPAMTRRSGRWVSGCLSGKDLCPGYRRFSSPWNIQGKRLGRHCWMTLGEILGVGCARADR